MTRDFDDWEEVARVATYRKKVRESLDSLFSEIEEELGLSKD